MGDDTIGGMFASRVQKYGDRVMMKHKVDGLWKDITWNQFYDCSRKLGLAMISGGVNPGDRVAIFANNSPEWQMVDMAAQSIGAADVPLYATITAKQAEYILSDSGSKMVFVGSKSHLDRVLEVCDDLLDLKKIVTLDGTTSDHPDVITFDDMLKLGAKNANPDEFVGRLEKVSPEDLCSIVYTSGTTGNPKGVMLLHRNFMSNVSTASSFVEVDDTDVCLSFLPLSHVLERMSGYYTSVYNGVTIAHAGSIDTLADDILQIRPHFMVSVPRLYEKIHAGVLANIDAEPPLKQKIFNWAVGVGRKVSELPRLSRLARERPLRTLFLRQRQGAVSAVSPNRKERCHACRPGKRRDFGEVHLPRVPQLSRRRAVALLRPGKEPPGGQPGDVPVPGLSDLGRVRPVHDVLLR
jgi:long-chain acyl-CoA synthetase